MRSTLSLWVLIIVFAFGLCLITGYPTYWITGSIDIAQVVGTLSGIIGIVAAYNVWDDDDDKD